MYRLSKIFEEDIEMQDAIEDFDDMSGDTDSMIAIALQDRIDDNPDENPHLFDTPEVNDDGLTYDEDVEAYTRMIANLYDDDDVDDNTDL